MEKLLDEVEAADGGAAAGSESGAEADLDARVRLYERVASEVKENHSPRSSAVRVRHVPLLNENSRPSTVDCSPKNST